MTQGKAILDGIEFRVSRMIYKDIYIELHGLWSWSFVCASVSLSILRSTIAANAFSRDLQTHKSQNFPVIAPPGVAILSTSPKVTIFPPSVPHYFISDQWNDFAIMPFLCNITKWSIKFTILLLHISTNPFSYKNFNRHVVHLFINDTFQLWR